MVYLLLFVLMATAILCVLASVTPKPCVCVCQTSVAGTGRLSVAHILLSSSAVPLPPLPPPLFVHTSSWLPKLPTNAWVLFPVFFYSIYSLSPALKGVCCHAEGATPFRLGCPRRKRHSNLSAYPLSRHYLILIPFASREFYHRTTAPPAFMPSRG